MELCELVTEPAAEGATGILMFSFSHGNEGSQCRAAERKGFHAQQNQWPVDLNFNLNAHLHINVRILIELYLTTTLATKIP